MLTTIVYEKNSQNFTLTFDIDERRGTIDPPQSVYDYFKAKNIADHTRAVNRAVDAHDKLVAQGDKEAEYVEPLFVKSEPDKILETDQEVIDRMAASVPNDNWFFDDAENIPNEHPMDWDGCDYDTGVVTVDPDKQQIRLDDRKAVQVRQRRDGLLLETDFTQIPDNPFFDEPTTITYRQELRDVPEQSGFPNDVVWPSIPDTINIPE